MTNILATPTPAGKPDDRPWWMLILLPAFLPLLLLPYLARDTWSAGGSGNWLADFLATPGFYVLAFAMLVLAALVSRRSRLRRFRGTMAWFGLTLLLATMAGQMLAENFRDEAINRLSRTAEPLVQAIGAYEARYGRAPETLDSLIPDFLAALPATGIPAAPAWQYQAFAPDHSGGVRWWLSARVGLIGEVTYYPESNCAPATCATGGKWRYWQW
jgi:hypothetical protein